nr:hypothetical protein [Saprospiraceae bacterium]
MFQTALHYLVSLLLFISTAGISVHQHFCKEELKSFALWTAATPCKVDAQSCSMDQDDSEDCDRGCCEDKVSFEKSDIDLHPTQSPLLVDISQQQLAVLPSLNIFTPTTFGTAGDFNSYRAPPLSHPSLQILYCTYLC